MKTVYLSILPCMYTFNINLYNIGVVDVPIRFTGMCTAILGAENPVLQPGSSASTLCRAA